MEQYSHRLSPILCLLARMTIEQHDPNPHRDAVQLTVLVYDYQEKLPTRKEDKTESLVIWALGEWF